MARGGKREGAGRKPTGIPTKIISFRVPLDAITPKLIDSIKATIRRCTAPCRGIAVQRSAKRGKP